MTVKAAASKAAARERDDGQKRLEAAEQRRVRELSKLEDEWRAKCAEQVKRAEGVGEERLERRMPCTLPTKPQEPMPKNRV